MHSIQEENDKLNNIVFELQHSLSISNNKLENSTKQQVDSSKLKDQLETTNFELNQSKANATINLEKVKALQNDNTKLTSDLLKMQDMCKKLEFDLNNLKKTHIEVCDHSSYLKELITGKDQMIVD